MQLFSLTHTNVLPISNSITFFNIALGPQASSPPRCPLHEGLASVSRRKMCPLTGIKPSNSFIIKFQLIPLKDPRRVLMWRGSHNFVHYQLTIPQRLSLYSIHCCSLSCLAFPTYCSSAAWPFLYSSPFYVKRGKRYADIHGSKVAGSSSR